jgi:DNA-binding transcriptional ArsR family regulator
VSTRHGISAASEVDVEAAEQVARVMGALATGSRVRILSRLRQGPRTVGDLTTALEMNQSAVSHQLRVLRDLGLVVGSRDGRHVVYELFDPHVAGLLDEALRHVAHLQADH